MSKMWSEAAEVKMPTALRDLVEETVRRELPKLPPAAAQEFDERGEVIAIQYSAQEQLILDEMVATGFRRGHVVNALAHVAAHPTPSSPLRVSVLSYLHLHVPEEDLPAAFRTSRPADATARLATNKDSAALARAWKAERVAKEMGAPIVAVERAMEEVDGVEGLAVELIGRRLSGWWSEAGGAAEVAGLTDTALLADVAAREKLDEDGKAALAQRREDEFELLEGVFGPRFRRIEGGAEIVVSTPPPRRKGAPAPTGPLDLVILRVLFHPASLYPSPPSPANNAPRLPSFHVVSPSLPSYILLHLTSLILAPFGHPSSQARHAGLDLALAGEGGVVAELANMLEEVYKDAIEAPPDARSVLRPLLGPPQVEAAAVEKAARGPKAGPKAGRPQGIRRATAAQHQALQDHSTRLRQTSGYQTMLRVREKLPAWSMQETIVDLIRNNRVVIVSGETGSGKTTQVPSFVMDDAIARGEGANMQIVVTQPRRVSAIGVASRVAAERCEDVNNAKNRPDSLVGYAIRGERKAGPGTRMLFCTTGVILARLSRGGDPDLKSISHIFIDEVHERSVDSDFLLLELRDILARNPTIKVILMSATINQKQFSDYFGGAPAVEIPGFTHPVQDIYLEESIPLLRNYSTSVKPHKKANQAQLDRMRASFMGAGVTNDRHLTALETLARADRIDFGLIGAVTALCIEQSRDVGGDILVFCTGVFEIKQACEAIRHAVSSQDLVEIMPLHANLTSQEQTAVFRPVKAGHRKIVVSTNVAETSITIDGIVYVIDTGRVKENQFDPETSLTRLTECWTSKAASRQRRGRAGRTRPGVCYKLFSHWTEDCVMAPHPTPEMVRIPLEALCLQIKAMRADADVKTFLSRALSPPDIRAIDSAWATLRLLGAIEEEGGTAARLTALGMHLAMVPVDLRLGKMLILAAIFKCLDPILTVVALLSSKPFFLNPMEQRDQAKKARSAFYTGRSDLLSDAKAFDACNAARTRSNFEMRTFMEENFISNSTYRDVLQLRGEYLNSLSDVGFVPFRCNPAGPALNENSANENLLKAIIFAGTGRLVRIKLPPAKFEAGLSGAIAIDRAAREIKFFERPGRVFLHPGSLLFTENRFETNFVTYFSKHVTGEKDMRKESLRDATEVPLYGILLFGEKVQVDLDHGVRVGKDNFVLFRSWPRIGVLVNALRELFDADLMATIEEPSHDTGASPVVKAMLECIARDGGLY